MKKYVKPLLLLLIAALIFLADRQFGWSAYLSDAGNLQFLQDLVQENLLLAVLVYIVLTIIGCVVLALPGITFAVFAGLLFVPCPDKGGLVLEKSLLPFFDGKYENIGGIQCCGLGGCASGKEPEISASFAATLKDRKLPNVYTYCASCAGRFRRSGVTNVRHVLVDILVTNEESELSLRSVWNRAKHRFF